MRSTASIFALDPFDPHTRLFTSPILPAPVLTGIRLLISTYVFASLAYSLAWAKSNDPQRIERHWSYFTNITNWSAAFYFLFAGGHGVGYCLTGTPPLNKWPKALQAAHQLFYTTVVTFPVLVTVVYWVILAPDDPPFRTTFGGWSNVTVHALNSVWALFEIFLTGAPMPLWIHIPFLILFLAGYLGLAYVTHATQGWYTYGFLNPDNGIGALMGYVFGILAGICVLFLTVRGLVWARIWVTERVCGLGLKKARRDPRGGREKGGEMELR